MSSSIYPYATISCKSQSSSHYINNKNAAIRTCMVRIVPTTLRRSKCHVKKLCLFLICLQATLIDSSIVSFSLLCSRLECRKERWWASPPLPSKIKGNQLHIMHSHPQSLLGLSQHKLTKKLDISHYYSILLICLVPRGIDLYNILFSSYLL